MRLHGDCRHRANASYDEYGRGYLFLLVTTRKAFVIHAAAGCLCLQSGPIAAKVHLPLGRLGDRGASKPPDVPPVNTEAPLCLGTNIPPFRTMNQFCNKHNFATPVR